MTKKQSWICDICKKEFNEGDSGYKTNIGFEIRIPQGTEYETGLTYFFEDTCLNCRANLGNAISQLIEE